MTKKEDGKNETIRQNFILAWYTVSIFGILLLLREISKTSQGA